MNADIIQVPTLIEATQRSVEARVKMATLGGPGSGNWGHKGRPGYIGGSAASKGGGGVASAAPEETPQQSATQKPAKRGRAVTMAEVREKIFADSYSQKDGVFTVRKGFYYRFGKTAEDFKGHVLEAFPTAKIEDYGEVNKSFRGGASVANQSHWFVKFSVKPEGEATE